MNKKIREWLETVLLAAAVVAVLYAVFWPFAISGDSMNDSFNDRDRIAISRAYAWAGRIARGDFAVCRLRRGGKDEYVMKRVIGLPGDSVTVTGGEVRVNGETLTESYTRGETVGEVELTLGDGEFFVMGDNRTDSYDSRQAGPVRAGGLVGKVLCRWFPFDKFTVYQ